MRGGDLGVFDVNRLFWHPEELDHLALLLIDAGYPQKVLKIIVDANVGPGHAERVLELVTHTLKFKSWLEQKFFIGLFMSWANLVRVEEIIDLVLIESNLVRVDPLVNGRENQQTLLARIRFAAHNDVEDLQNALGNLAINFKNVVSLRSWKLLAWSLQGECSPFLGPLSDDYGSFLQPAR